MREYYVGAKEGEGKKRFLRPRKTRYFAIFEPKLNLGETWEQRTENAKENRQWGRETGLVQEIEADSIDELARKIVVTDMSAERISTIKSCETNDKEKIITINGAGEEELLGWDEVSGITRKNYKTIAITKSGEKKECKTHKVYGDMELLIRHHSQMRYDKLSQRETYLICAHQGAVYSSNNSMSIEPRMDLNLKEQRQLGDKIGYILKQREKDWRYEIEPEKQKSLMGRIIPSPEFILNAAIGAILGSGIATYAANKLGIDGSIVRPAVVITTSFISALSFPRMFDYLVDRYLTDKKQIDAKKIEG